MYVHWKILHSMWTVVLQLEWGVLQLSSSKFQEHEEWTNMKNGILLKFELDDVALTTVKNAYLDWKWFILKILD